MSQHDVTLLLGSNLGDTERNIETALNFIEIEVGPIIRRSNILFTKPVEFASNNIFCNIVVLIKTQFSPVNLLNFIKRIELDMGRKEDSSVTNAYVDRIIDIDIVLYGDLKFECKTLQIPHKKHLYEREFSRNLLMSIKTH
ncbi:2-amino-4-hydroxy-6-hydroxymethyldihydropteridine diphosphokinase [Kaistella jeonii]|uniref:2-amino-4-hydroxy-6-hydroxymethyldihydropteridine pyrophosphokinase n=1 Tax=Kaistella jeonii TaxID=266749 RepID=A0A0C1FP72_9FLAO|nr:2-amino-4-hydroxy-6-hydroxymethyldihydropteridine diphosphokinase [Kaistella jeonii]KIA89664.1 2-amino-4-hydroxy-6-hydroxymethyldihydropteridine pyrophosphokinase [Kaistella jeonii]SFB88921.1 2-amino-4-hydroxy-6-hydroxymethyldihydropteridinediphosphokinase [Kaistella jeonii]VEI95883.1 2-amino-4-hydroxy-6-hydroxymethyldihydropteridinepyrophosphokinase [Kaistella jeonii]